MIVVRPQIGHWYGPLQTLFWREIAIAFNGSFFDPILNPKNGLIKQSLIKLHDKKKWIHRLKLIKPSTHTNPQKRSWHDLNQVNQLLFELHNEISPPTQLKWETKLRKEISLIYRLPVDYHLLAKKMHVSYPTFFRKFKDIFGQSPHQYLLKHILLLSIMDLHESRKPRASIAEKYGFYDEGHFSKIFKKIIGKTPNKYLDSMR